jgi:acyl-CoA reductase-like NAD-dependent aldehyde dehydrogenase
MQSQLILDNQSVAAQSGATFNRVHPNTGEVVTSAAAGGVADAVAAANSAQAAFQSWRHSAPSERRRLLLKAADVLESKTPQFIEADGAEVGASGLWAGFNVFLAANVFREAASMVTQIQGETIPTDKPGALSMTVRQPVGVILSIVPWNGPWCWLRAPLPTRLPAVTPWCSAPRKPAPRPICWWPMPWWKPVSHPAC